MRHSKKIFNHFIKLILGLAILMPTSLVAQDGENLFKANCASCHKVTAQRLVGPGLQGIEDRWENRENLVAWIKNSQQYLKDNKGDKYAHELYKSYNQSIMPAFPLSTEEVDAILEYIANPPAAAVPVQVAEQSNAVYETGEDYTFYWMLGIVLVLLVLVKILVDVKTSINKLILIKDGKLSSIDDLPKSVSGIQGLFLWMQSHKTYVALLIIGLIGFGATKGWYALKGIGIYQGYAPEQPIKFSHKIHAGENGISCEYCHNSVEKSKSAGIPSVNICMNCHAGIQEGKRWGTEEIAKIYEASGYNPESGQYENPEKPIKWVRIHNLPNHAYFNHSQHVVVGKQECTTCHGDVANIDYPMLQHSELTMGWCIDCHLKTDVAMEGNAYYDEVHQQLKEKYAAEGLDIFQVKHIGGIECAKCHY